MCVSVRTSGLVGGKRSALPRGVGAASAPGNGRRRHLPLQRGTDPLVRLRRPADRRLGVRGLRGSARLPAGSRPDRQARPPAHAGTGRQAGRYAFLQSGRAGRHGNPPVPAVVWPVPLGRPPVLRHRQLGSARLARPPAHAGTGRQAGRHAFCNPGGPGGTGTFQFRQWMAGSTRPAGGPSTSSAGTPRGWRGPQPLTLARPPPPPRHRRRSTPPLMSPAPAGNSPSSAAKAPIRRPRRPSPPRSRRATPVLAIRPGPSWHPATAGARGPPTAYLGPWAQTPRPAPVLVVGNTVATHRRAKLASSVRFSGAGAGRRTPFSCSIVNGFGHTVLMRIRAGAPRATSRPT